MAASLSSDTAKNNDPREAFAAFVCDEATTQTLGPIVAEQGWSAERIQGGGIANAVRSLTVMQSPEFLIVDLTESENPRSDINALAEVCEPGTVVLAVGNENDVGLYRDLVNSGIHDYLVKPVTSDVLREAIVTAEAALHEPAGGEDVAALPNRICAVIGVRGGVGASALTTGCAWIMAHELDRQVALLDLDIHFGTDALAFDLEPGRGLCDALENPSRVDGLFLERAVIKESDKLAILGAEAPISEPLLPDPTALQHLEEELRQNFECVMLDMPRALVAHYPNVLTEANEIVVVTDLSLAATRDTIRVLAFLDDVASDATVYLVANKVPSGAAIEVSVKDFEASVERSVDFVIPLDIKSAVAAAKLGKTLPQAAGGSRPVNVMRKIAQKLAGVKEADRKKPFWAQFIKRAKK